MAWLPTIFCGGCLCAAWHNVCNTHSHMIWKWCKPHLCARFHSFYLYLYFYCYFHTNRKVNAAAAVTLPILCILYCVISCTDEIFIQGLCFWLMSPSYSAHWIQSNWPLFTALWQIMIFGACSCKHIRREYGTIQLKKWEGIFLISMVTFWFRISYASWSHRGVIYIF